MSAVIGYATVQLIPSFEGLEAKANSQLGQPLSKVSDEAGKKSGGIFGNGFWTTIGHVMVAGALYKVGQSIAHGIGAGIETGLKTASFMQQAQISLETLLGSGGKAQSLLTELSAFAAKTPFDLPGVITGTQQLLGAGAAASSVIPTMTALGDTEAALGGSSDALSHTMMAWTQLMTRGKIDTQDLLQISNQGIPIWKELAKALGKPTTAIQDLVASGDLMSDTVLPKLQAQLEKDYGGSMAKQALTLAGVWSTVKDTITQALGQAFTPLTPILANVLPGAAAHTADAILGMSHGIQVMAGFLKSTIGPITATLGPAFSSVFKGIQSAIAPFTSTIAASLKQIGPAVSGILPAFFPFTTILKALLPLIAPIAGAFAQLAAQVLPVLMPLLALAAQKFTIIVGIIDQLGLILAGALGQALAAIVPVIGQVFGAIVRLIGPLLIAKNSIFPQLAAILSGPLLAAFSTLLSSALTVVLGLFKQLVPVALQIIEAFMPLATMLISTLIPVIMQLVQSLLPPLMSLFKALMPILTPIVGIIAQIALVLAQTLVPIIKALLPIVTTVISTIIAIIKPIVTIITGVINVIAGVLTGNWSQAWDGIKQIFSGVWDLILAILKGAWDIIVSVFNAIGPTIAALWNGAWNALGAIFSGIWNWLVGVIKTEIRVAVGVIATIKSKILAVFNGARNWLVGIATDIWNGFQGAWKAFTNGLYDLFVKPFKDAINGVKGLLGIHSPSTVMRDMATNLAKGFTNGLHSSAGAIQDAYGVFGAPTIGAMAPNVKPGGLMAAAMANGNDGALQPVHVDAAGVLDLIQQVADGRIQLFAKKGAQSVKSGRLY